MTASMTPVSVKTTIQRLWDALELASHREAVQSDEAYMARHRQRIANSETIWVDCHDQRVTLLPDGSLRIGKQLYHVRQEVENNRYLRCVCAGCSFDMSYCLVNHQVRIREYTYQQLVQRAKRPPTNLADGTVIRFEEPFEFTDHTKHDTFRKGTYRKPIWRNGNRVIQRCTIFYALDNDLPYHIIHWKRYNYEIVSTPDTVAPAR